MPLDTLAREMGHSDVSITHRAPARVRAPFPTGVRSHSLTLVSVADIQLLGSAERTAALHAATLPQKDNLCGGFIGSVALGAFGVDADQDEVAAAAGAILPAGGDPARWLPPEVRRATTTASSSSAATMRRSRASRHPGWCVR